MKIAIIAAMDKELNLILKLMQEYTEKDADGVKIYSGKIGGNEVVAAKCGIGKVNSALNTYKIIKSEHPDLVINSGVAGGGGNGLRIGDVLFADRVVYHDVWCGPSTEYGAADGLELYMRPSEKIQIHVKSLGIDNLNYGLICSGDKFISKAEEVSEIKGNFPDVKAIDMESASIAQTCILNGVDFAIVRVVSDTPGEGENISQYQNFWSEAPEKTFRIVETIVESL